MPAFWDGSRNKMIVRFTPTEAGQWIYRVTSNLPAFDGKEGMFNAAASDSPGFVNVANVHHWATDNKQPHLWMGYIADRFAFDSAAEFEQQLNEAAQNKFNHFRGSILGNAKDRARVYLGPGSAQSGVFRRTRPPRRGNSQARNHHRPDARRPIPTTITALFPDWQARERFVRYVVGALRRVQRHLAGPGGIRGLSRRPRAAEGVGTGSEEAGSVPASAIVERENYFVAAARGRLDGLRHRRLARTTRSARWSISFTRFPSSASPTRSTCGTPPWTASIPSFAATNASVAKTLVRFHGGYAALGIGAVLRCRRRARRGAR